MKLLETLTGKDSCYQQHKNLKARRPVIGHSVTGRLDIVWLRCHTSNPDVPNINTT
jgi:hypothetical protein